MEAYCPKCREEIDARCLKCPLCEFDLTKAHPQVPVQFYWEKRIFLALFIFLGWLYNVYHPCLWSTSHHKCGSISNLIIAIVYSPLYCFFSLCVDAMKLFFNIRLGIQFAWAYGIIVSFGLAYAFIGSRKPINKKNLPPLEVDDFAAEEERGTKMGEL